MRSIFIFGREVKETVGFLMSLNQLVEPIHPLDIVVDDLTVLGSFDIGSIAVDDLLVQGNLTLDHPLTNGVLYVDGSSNVQSQRMLAGEILIGNGSAFPPSSAQLTGSSNIVIQATTGSIEIATSSHPSFSSVETTTLTVDSFLNLPLPSAANFSVLTCVDSIGTAEWAPGGISPSTDLVANTIQLNAATDQIILGAGPQGSNYPLIITAPNGIISEYVGFPRTGINSDVVLTQGAQTIVGATKFTSATEFTRLDATDLGTNNILITGSPNINASTANAVVIGGDTADAINYSNSVVIGANNSQTVATMTGHTLVGTSIEVDNASTDNVVIGNAITVTGSNHVVLGGSNTTDLYSMGGANVDLGTTSHPFGTLRIADDIIMSGGSTSDITIVDSVGVGSMTIFNNGFTGAYGLALPATSGFFLTRDVAGTVAQLTSPTTPVTYNGYTVAITTQPMTTAALSTTTFRLNNSNITTVVTPAISMLSIQNYSGTLMTNGIPSVIGSAVGAGSIDIIVINSHPTNALSGTLEICYQLI